MSLLQVIVATLIVIVALAAIVCRLGNPLIARYLAEDRDDPLAQANRDLKNRPRLGAPTPLP